MNATPDQFWSIHTHSMYSAKDALTGVQDIVDRAVELSYPALALTDHGNLGGLVKHYKACRKAGIEPVPGIEAYVTFDRRAPKVSRVHLGVLAVSQVGYRNLVGLNNLAHANFKHKPLLDMGDFASLAADGLLEGLACTTGCWFGVLPAWLRTVGDMQAMENVLKALDRWFGGGAWVEIQRHAVKTAEQDDEDVASLLLAIANRCGLPVVLGQDSHYVHADQRPVHEMLKRLSSWNKDDPDTALFPGDGYHMVDAQWMRDHHDERVYAAGMAGLRDFAEMAHVRIDEMEAFRLAVPDVALTEDPHLELCARARRALAVMIAKGKVPHSRTDEYIARLDEELSVIEASGMAGYLLYVANVTDWINAEGITFGVRGSAGGALTCWLLGITHLDPVAWRLEFGRFLSKDRTSPPDIDIDCEYERRGGVLQWMANSFPVARIGTWAKLGLDSKQRDDEEDVDATDVTGSLVRQYRTMVSQSGGDPQARIKASDWAALQELARIQPYMNIGTNAAGVLVVPDEQTLASVPMSWIASSKTMVAQYDKKDIEAIGLLKVDVMGVRLLSALKEACDLAGIDRWSIPLNDRATFSMISAGKVSGCFQLQGKATLMGCHRLKPGRISEVIDAMALFRPSPMGSGATQEYLQRKEDRQRGPVRHPLIDAHTSGTRGVLLYQDQVLGIMRDLGMGADDLTTFLKAVKASNSAIGDAGTVIAGYRRIVQDLCESAGVPGSDMEWLWGQVLNFASYSFNKAHATIYGVMAYQSAYMRRHHPVPFWVGVLNAYRGTDKELGYIRDAREQSEVDFYPAHVNTSGERYRASTSPGGTPRIVKSLVGIPNVGEAAAREIAQNAPYDTVMDIAARCSNRAVTGCGKLKKGVGLDDCGGVMNALHKAGALRGLTMDIPAPAKKRARKIDTDAGPMLLDLH